MGNYNNKKATQALIANIHSYHSQVSGILTFTVIIVITISYKENQENNSG